MSKTRYTYRKKRYVADDGTVGYAKVRDYSQVPRQQNPTSQKSQKVNISSKGTVKIGNVTLPVNAVPNPDYVPENQYVVGQTDILEAMALAVSQNMPVLLVGETGTGKTTLVNDLGYQTNNSVRQINLNGNTTVDEIVGRTMLNKEGTTFHDGIMIDAMRQGHWLLLDELNAGLPEVLLALQQVLIDGKYTLVEHNNEVVRAHPNFRVFATMNPADTYIGTNHLNPATLSRFGVTIEVPFPSAKLELDIIKSKLPTKARSADSEIAETVRLATDVRNGFAQQEYSYLLSTRDLISWHKLNEHYGDLVKSAKYTVLGKCNNDDRMALESILKVYFSAPLNVTESDGQLAMKYKKGNLVQVCNDKLTVMQARQHGTLGTAKTGAVFEVLQSKQGQLIARLLKGEVVDEDGEKVNLSHRDSVRIEVTSVPTRRVDSK